MDASNDDLLSHGYGATSAMFDQNLAALWSGHRVITWDLRGHGGSDSPADPASYSAGNAVADMVAILDQLGVDRAILGGHSLGTATPTLYGWLDSWNTTTVPNGSYVLVSYATGPGGNTASAGVGVTVQN